MRDNWFVWGFIGLIVLGSALPAALAGWAPWEIVALAAVVGSVSAVLAGVWAWYSLQLRKIELAALTSDDQAARLLGEAMAKCGAHLYGNGVKEVWDTFAMLSSESKRAFTLAVTGVLSSDDGAAAYGTGEKITAIAKSFRGPNAEAPLAPQCTNEEQAAMTLGKALGAVAGYFNEGVSEEVWAAFAELNGDAKLAMVNAVTGFLSTADHDYHGVFGDQILEIVRSFRPGTTSDDSPRKKTLEELLTPDIDTPTPAAR